MSHKIVLPKIGFSMTSATFVEWLVVDGAQVKEDEPLYAIENEKAIEEVPAPAAGVVKQAAVPDQEYQVGDVLGTIE